jgi:hypothetical protein
MWLFAMDEFLLAVGWFTCALLVYTSNGRSHKPFSKSWAHFSMFGGCFAVVGCALNIARVFQWATLSMAAGVVIGLIYAIILPIWIISLGVQLKSRSDPAGAYGLAVGHLSRSRDPAEEEVAHSHAHSADAGAVEMGAAGRGADHGVHGADRA